jgi:hypothetical protein
MEAIANILLISGTLAATFYCRVLASRVSKLKDLNKGLDQAIMSLSNNIETLRATLDATRSTSQQFSQNLADVSQRAEIAAGRLHILLCNTPKGKLDQVDEKANGPEIRHEFQQMPMRLRSSTTAYGNKAAVEAKNDDIDQIKERSSRQEKSLLLQELKLVLGAKNSPAELI